MMLPTHSLAFMQDKKPPQNLFTQCWDVGRHIHPEAFVCLAETHLIPRYPLQVVSLFSEIHTQ
jgi:hypothetical protein